MSSELDSTGTEPSADADGEEASADDEMTDEEMADDVMADQEMMDATTFQVVLENISGGFAVAATGVQPVPTPEPPTMTRRSEDSTSIGPVTWPSLSPRGADERHRRSVVTPQLGAESAD